MRILFMGTGEIALPSFEMVADRHELVGLVTQPDKPVGRHAKMHAPRIKELACGAGVPVLQPERVRRRSALEAIAELAPELIVVMAYGQILPVSLLEMPPRGCINLHASLLPRHRGASCVQAAIDAGDAESGVTVMHMAKGLDTGDIILRERIALAADETGGSLHDRLAEVSPGVLADALRALAAGDAPRIPQDDALATYAAKLERADGEIDWARPAADLARRVRAYDPWPGTFTVYCDERGRRRRLKIFPPAMVAPGEGTAGETLAVDNDGILVGCGEGALRVSELQPEGARRMSAREFLAGHPHDVGSRFFSLASGGE